MLLCGGNTTAVDFGKRASTHESHSCRCNPGGARGPEVHRRAGTAPERGQVVVAIEYAGVNFFDVYQRDGHYPFAMPFTLGTEAAGRVAAVGRGA